MRRPESRATDTNKANKAFLGLSPCQSVSLVSVSCHVVCSFMVGMLLLLWLIFRWQKGSRWVGGGGMVMGGGVGFNFVCTVWQHQAKQTCAPDPLSLPGNCAEGATFY